MVLTASIDYASSYFQYPVLDKIHGKPTYETLKKLKKQLKSNAQSVESSLGGGRYGHLGLVINPTEYAKISTEAFVKPARPTPFQVPPFTANHDMVRLQSEYDDTVATYRTCEAVERTLIQQLVTALDGEFIKDLRDATTHNIRMAVHEVLDHLFESFGQVTPEDLLKEEIAMGSFYWDLNDPPVIMFNKIEDLLSLSEAAKMPKTEAQIVNYGLTLIKKTNDFEQALLNWYNKPLVDQTYANFKTHFTEAQKELKQVRGPKLRDTQYHQANEVTQLKAEMNRMKDEFMATMNVLTEASLAQEETEHQIEPPAVQEAPSGLNAAMLQLIQSMQKQLDASTSGKGTGKQPSKYRGRRNTSKYCWSHGACAHEGSECKYPKPGHKKEATFANKMGGSLDYCKECNE